MKRVKPDGTVRIGPVQSIPGILQELGADPARVLAEAKIDAHLFDDPDNILSFKARAHLMGVCRDWTHCDHFGLLVGQRGGLPSFGLVGYLAQHSRDVESAIRSLINHFHLHVQGSAVTLEVEGGLAFMGYDVHQKNIEAADQLIDAGVAVTFNVLQQLCGSSMTPTQVAFCHRQPPDLKPFRQFFRTPLSFDADTNGVFFEARWLQRPVQGADPELRRLLEKQVNDLEARYSDDFPEQVRRILHSALMTNHSTVDDVAALFSIHSRTLHRRLRAHGTTFKAIADQCRFAMAQQMLEFSDMELAQIADMLNYSGPRSFNRAFKRWSGTTPARWRQRRVVPPPQ